jgi:hypothetical protein
MVGIFILTLGGLHEKHAVQRGIGYQLSICSGIEENHGKTLVKLTGRRTFLNSIQQSGIKYMNPNVVPCLNVALFQNFHRVCLVCIS